MHQLPSQQVPIDLNSYDVDRIDQPSFYPSPLYIPPSYRSAVVCTRIVDFSIFSAPWAKQLEAISGRSILDEFEPEFATLFALRAQALNITGKQIFDVLSTALGALTEQGFTVKDVRYHCNDFEMDIDLAIELVVECSLEQACDLWDHVIEAIDSQHENPLTDLIHLGVNSLRDNDRNT
jgi:hypothetical protein